MESKFIEASKRERWCLMTILPLIKEMNPKFTWTEYITDIFGYDSYDCLLQAWKDGSVKIRYIIEVKLRTNHYDELILETKKLNDLKKKILDPTTTEIIYINVTPNGTFLFNISRLEKEGKLITSKMIMNKSTMRSTSNKIEKGIILLNIAKARRFDFKFNEVDYLKWQKSLEENNKGRATKDMWLYLIGKN